MGHYFASLASGLVGLENIWGRKSWTFFRVWPGFGKEVIEMHTYHIPDTALSLRFCSRFHTEAESTLADVSA